MVSDRSRVSSRVGVCVFLTVRPSSPSTDEASGKDFKFVMIEKDNAPVKKETERLVTTKDTGKQFMSAAPAGNNQKQLIQGSSAWKPFRRRDSVSRFSDLL